MPFDINALIADPQFQMGLGLMGASSPKNKPLLDAYMVMQAAQARKQAEQQRNFQNDIEQQKLAIDVSQGKRAEAQSKLYEQQVLDQQRRTQQQEKLQLQLQQYLPGIMKQLGMSGGTDAAAPSGQPPMDNKIPIPQVAAPAPSNLFNLADKFVANIEGGFVANDGGKGPTNYGVNQTANPDVNVKDLTPDSASQLRKTRYWDAIGGDQLPPATAMVAYDAAINQGQAYAKQLLQSTGGDPTLMIYQRRQDYRSLAKNPVKAPNLSGWEDRLNKLAVQVKGLSAEAPAPAQPAAPAQTQAGGLEPYRALGALGGIMKLQSGDVGGLSDLGTAMKPSTQKPGDVILGPGGKTTTIPNPAEQQRLANEATRIQQENERLAREAETSKRTNAAAEQKVVAQRATDFGQVRGVLDSAKQLTAAAGALRANPGLDHITGRYSILPDSVRTMIDPQGMNAKADLDALGSKVLLNAVTSLKSLSTNGSTGFGQLSNIEGQHLVNSVASLKQAQTTEQVKDRLAIVMKATNTVMDRAVDVYEKTHSESPYSGLPVGTRPLRDSATGEQKMSKNGFPLLKLPNGKMVEERQ